MFIPKKKCISSALLSSLIAAGVVGGGLKAETQNAIQPLESEAVWTPGMTIMQDIRQECSSLSGRQFGECFANGMQKAGASPQAVAFTHRIDNTGYMRDFRPVGRVSIAYVNFPFRANENQGAYLVNGTPSLINIDDQSLLAKSELKKNPVYTRLAKKYSEITLFPDDRSGTSYLIAERLPRGEQRFIVGYRLQNVCHACERVGKARFAFDFDSTGKFLGTKLISVTAADQEPAARRRGEAQEEAAIAQLFLRSTLLPFSTESIRG